MKNFKSYLTEGPAGVTSNEIKADQDRVKKAQDWNRKETQRQMNNVPAPGVYSPGDDEGPVSSVKSPNKKLKEGRAEDAFADLDKEIKKSKTSSTSNDYLDNRPATSTGTTNNNYIDNRPATSPSQSNNTNTSKSTKVKDMNPLDREQWERDKKASGIKEETLDERAIRVRNVRSGAVRNVSSAFRHIYRKQGWNAVRGTRR